jgi:hypothetical protein
MEVMIEVLVVLMAFGLGVLVSKRKKPAMGMTRKQRVNYINLLLNDKVGEAIEELYYQNQITLWERNRFYRQFAARRGTSRKECGWHDVTLPKKKVYEPKVVVVPTPSPVEDEKQPVVTAFVPKKTFADRFRELFKQPS